CAARTQNAALTVEQHLRGDRDRLLIRPLLVTEAALAVAVAHRLVLQRALAALVADRAVEGMVEQKELEVARLRLLRDRRRELRLDDHPFGHGRRAGRERLALALDLDDALTAGAERLEQRVVAE